MVVCQFVLYEGVDDGIKVTAYECDNTNPHADQGCFEMVRYGTAYQYFDARVGHFLRPSEGMPGFKKYTPPSHLGAACDLYKTQPVRYVKDR